MLTVPLIYQQYTKGIEDEIDIVTKTINARTDASIEHSDILLFFPGGIGTIYELLSCIETKRAGEHKKPIIIANFYGIFDDLLQQLEKCYQQKFAELENKDTYVVGQNAQQVIQYLKTCV